MNTRGAKLQEFVEVLKLNGHKTFSNPQLRKGIKKYFGIRDSLVAEYIHDLVKLGLIENDGESGMKLIENMAGPVAKAGEAKQCVGEKKVSGETPARSDRGPGF